MDNPAEGIDQSAGDFTYNVDYEYDAGAGLNEDTVRYISNVKKEEDWILEFRLKALKVFEEKPMPTNWATEDLNNIDFDKIRYYLSQGNNPSVRGTRFRTTSRKPSSVSASPNRSVSSSPGWKRNLIPKPLIPT